MTPFGAWKARPGRSTLVALLEASQGRVFALCLDVLRHREDAEEAAQEALLSIVLGLDRVADAEHYESWSATVARRTALDRQKSRRRRREREFRSAGRRRDGAGPYEGLHDAIARLPEEDRALIQERYFDRQTFERMGRNRGLSDVGIRKRIEKAHERLKRMLGCALPGALWKNVFTVGATAMKLKTVANGVAILILLLIVTIGAWRIVVPRLPETRPARKSLPARKSEVGRAPIAPTQTTREAIPERATEPPVDSKAKPLPPGHAARILHIANQIALAARRIPQILTDSRESLTEDEGRRLQRVAKELEDGLPALFADLKGLVGLDPAEARESVVSGLQNRLHDALVSLIKDAVESEIDSENSPAGPLLAGLLELESGETADKKLLLKLSRGLDRANRALGGAAVRLITDPDATVRYEAARTLSDQARRGALKNFLLENAEALRQAASTADEHDYLARGFALTALAALVTPDNDEFVLQRFEISESVYELRMGFEAILQVAPRIAGRSEARLYQALLRSPAMPSYPRFDPGVADLALYLPDAKCLDVLRAATSAGAGGLEGYIWYVDNGKREELRDLREKARREGFGALLRR